MSSHIGFALVGYHENIAVASNACKFYDNDIGTFPFNTRRLARLSLYCDTMRYSNYVSSFFFFVNSSLFTENGMGFDCITFLRGST